MYSDEEPLLFQFILEMLKVRYTFNVLTFNIE